MDAILLCGGLGTRIRTLTQDSYPKAMITLSGKTILQWELEWLRKNSVKHAILAVRHLAEYIEEQFGKIFETTYGEIDISYSRETEKLGSGGAVKLATQYVSSNHSLIMNGDIITNFNLEDMINFHNNGAEIGTIAVTKMKSPFGIIDINQENKILFFKEKPILDHWIHAGVDIFRSDILNDFPDKGQMEETIFVELAEQRELRSFQIETKYYWRSIDNPKDLQETEKEWKGLETI